MPVSREKVFVVLDIGGTNFRIGYYAPGSGEVFGVRRFPVDNFHRLPEVPIVTIQERLVGQITNQIAGYMAASSDAVRAVGISFAGPINAAGEVVTAPTIWGRQDSPLPLAKRVGRELAVPVVAMNDVSAACWRYSLWHEGAFCLITVSSGIGNKVFWNGEILVGPDGHGGEIGHYRCDLSEEAPMCDCGGKGHLGAIASGRGIVELAKRLGRRQPQAFRNSRLAQLADQSLAAVSSKHIADAVHQRDVFATHVLRSSLTHMASAIAGVYSAIGVRKYIFIGGFALALGKTYIEYLGRELRRVGCFGLAPQEIDNMLVLGELDDDHSLIGAGVYLQRLADGGRLLTQ